MKLDGNFLRTIFCGLAGLALAVSANATTITGQGWEVTSAAANDAVIASVPGSAAQVNFTITGLGISLNPTDSSSNYTLASFLATDAAVSGVTYSGGAAGTDSMDNTIWEFTGTATFTHGEMFTVDSDDGFTLYAGCTGAACGSSNIVESDPGPQSLTVTNFSYSGSTVTEAFTFVYAECCGAPAEFVTNLASGGNVPEPSGIVLFGTLLFGAATLLRRKKVAANGH